MARSEGSVLARSHHPTALSDKCKKSLTSSKSPHNRIGYHYLVYQFEMGDADEKKWVILRM